jgi:hypothetical protein
MKLRVVSGVICFVLVFLGLDWTAPGAISGQGRLGGTVQPVQLDDPCNLKRSRQVPLAELFNQPLERGQTIGAQILRTVPGGLYKSLCVAYGYFDQSGRNPSGPTVIFEVRHHSDFVSIVYPGWTRQPSQREAGDFGLAMIPAFILAFPEYEFTTHDVDPAIGGIWIFHRPRRQ